RAIWVGQQSARFFGSGACFGLGHPCQKQPSTKRTIFCRGNTKSGLPNNRGCRRQPRMRFTPLTVPCESIAQVGGSSIREYCDDGCRRSAEDNHRGSAFWEFAFSVTYLKRN